MWSSGLREESSINKRGQNRLRGEWSSAERREKQPEQGIGRRRRRLRTRGQAEESDESEDEAAGVRTTESEKTARGQATHKGHCENWRERLQREIGRGTRRPRVGWMASTTLLSLESLCGGGVPSSHPSLGLSVFFLSFFLQKEP